jgi:hypothetical protein
MPTECIPDLLVAGNGVLCSPTFNEKKHLMPFNEPNHSSGFCIFKTKHNALAIGLCHLLWALDRIQLGTMPWEEIIVHGLDQAPLKSS